MFIIRAISTFLITFLLTSQLSASEEDAALSMQKTTAEHRIQNLRYVIARYKQYKSDGNRVWEDLSFRTAPTIVSTGALTLLPKTASGDLYSIMNHNGLNPNDKTDPLLQTVKDGKETKAMYWLTQRHRMDRILFEEFSLFDSIRGVEKIYQGWVEELKNLDNDDDNGREEPAYIPATASTTTSNVYFPSHVPLNQPPDVSYIPIPIPTYAPTVTQNIYPPSYYSSYFPQLPMILLLLFLQLPNILIKM